jgi:hypothetical protein
MMQVALVSQPGQDDWNRRRRWGLWAGIIGGLIGILLTLIAVVFEWEPARKPFATGLWVFWTVIPPTWFLIEYRYVGRPPSSSPEMKDRFDAFKYSQDLAAKLWLGIVASLGAFVLGHF